MIEGFGFFSYLLGGIVGVVGLYIVIRLISKGAFKSYFEEKNRFSKKGENNHG